MDRIGPTNTITQIQALQRVHASRAYKAAPVQQTEPIARINTRPTPAQRAQGLIAGKVRALDPISDLENQGNGQPRTIGPVVTSAGTYALHPSASATNIAATGVASGRSLDLRG